MKYAQSSAVKSNSKSAFFLACSWFWCIGGFFPVLIVAEFGGSAFIPFAICNVLGAAGFGVVLNEHRRNALLQRFSTHAQIFSVIVAGYQAIFIAWISLLVQSYIPFVAFCTIAALLYWAKKHLSLIAIAVFFITAIMMYTAVFQNDSTSQVYNADSSGFGHYLVPIALAFLFAPYFDLTFHRAYAQSDNPRLAFIIGFCILFLIFLVAMFFAVPILASLWSPSITTNSTSLSCMLAALTVQTAFTTSAHLREIHKCWLSKTNVIRFIGVIGVCIALHIGIALGKSEQLFNTGVMMYRGFLFIIGAYFPTLLIFGWGNVYFYTSVVVLGICYTVGYIIGGSLTYFLSIGMCGLAIIFIAQRLSKKT